MREQRIALEHDADVALPWRHIVERLACQFDAAGCRALEAGQHHQRRGLAGPRCAEQRQELAAPNLEVEVANSQRRYRHSSY